MTFDERRTADAKRATYELQGTHVPDEEQTCLVCDPGPETSPANWKCPGNRIDWNDDEENKNVKL